MLLLGIFGYQLLPAFADQADGSQLALNDVEFNNSLVDLPADSKGSMLKRFSNVSSALPGTYRADIFVNDYWQNRRDIQIRDNKSAGGSQACFTPAMLAELNLDYSRVPDAKALQALPAGECVDLAKQLPGASLSFNSGELRLDISVPQIFLRRQARGYVSPDLWSPGVPLAGFLNYNLNVSRSAPDNGDSSSQYFLSAQTGINLGVWRLRHSSALSQQLSGGDQSARYQRLSTYAQRDLPDWRSTLTIGETYTPSEFFTSIAFRGIQLRSDDRMLPDSQTGYAPVIRGVADSNAKVTVKQGNNIIYETTVPPGQFQIDDMYNTGYAGDLEVTITETDGRIKQFTQTYAAVPQLLRPGFSRFSFSVGELYAKGSPHPGFVQGTYQRGINNELTMYGGVLGANRYFSGVLGAALSTPLGALSADVTHSQALFDSNSQALPHKLEGQSYRLSYSKLLNATNTNLMLAAYRYSTQGYMEFGDFNYAQQYGARYQPMKSRFSLSLNQPFAEGWGSLTLSGSTQSYWNRGERDTQYMLNYNNTFRKWLSYGVSASRTKSATGEHSNQYMVSVSIPLEKLPSSPMLSASYSTNSDHRHSEQVAISGTAGELRNYSYSAYANSSHNNGDNRESYGAYGSYAGSKGTLNGSFSQSSGSSQQMLGLAGGMVFHPGGITLSQTVGETIAVIEAKGAEGAAVNNMPGTRIDSRGYAVASNLQPYRMNDVSIDPKGMNEDVELQSSSVAIAPNSGAVVMLKFPTITGKPVLVNLKLKSGESVPLGADVLAENGDSITVVGQSGRVFLRGQEGKPLRIKWGDGDKLQCSFRYQLPAVDNHSSDSAIRNAESTCE